MQNNIGLLPGTIIVYEGSEPIIYFLLNSDYIMTYYLLIHPQELFVGSKPTWIFLHLLQNELMYYKNMIFIKR